MEELISEYRDTRKTLIKFLYKFIGEVGFFIIIFIIREFSGGTPLFLLLGLPVCLLSIGIYKNLEYDYIQVKKKYLCYLQNVERTRYEKNIKLEVAGNIAVKGTTIIYCFLLTLSLIQSV